MSEAKISEAVAWFTENHLTDKSATTYDPAIAERWRAKGWPVTALYTHPQPAELAFDVEAMLAACVPGGNIVDPQVVADNIRAWAAERKSAELAEQQGVALRYLTQRELDSIGSQAEGMDGEQWDRWVQAKFAEVNGLATVDSDGFIALAATGKQQVGAFPWENLPCYLINKCEGDTISEEGIQRAVADMAKDSRYCPPQQVGEMQRSHD